MRLSYIVTIYNASDYIEQCIRSFYHQGMAADDFEVIAVDNATPDDSMQIVGRLQTEYPNLRIVTLSENHCPGGGRNEGLRHAQGDYILFVDADDFLYPDSVEDVLKKAEQENLDFILFDYDRIIADSITVLPETPDTPAMSGSDLMFSSGPRWQKHIVVWRKLFKRVFLADNKLFFPEDIIYDDDSFSFRAYAAAKRTMHIGRKVYVHRCYEGSTCRKREDLPLVRCLLIQSADLLAIIDNCEGQDLNRRFIPTVEKLLRYNLAESFRCYQKLSGQEKKEARRLLHHTFAKKGMCRYFSRKQYVLFKLSLK